MAYKEVSLGHFLNARSQASEALRREGIKESPRTELNLEEAHLLLASSHLLTLNETFYGIQLIRLTGLNPGMVYPLLKRFENNYQLFNSALEKIDPSVEGRPPRRLYAPTPLGHEVTMLFQPSVNAEPKAYK